MSDKKMIDLHVHSSASDGTLEPAQVVKHAYESGLSAIALTDHDTIAGVEEALRASADYPIEVIPGIELSAGYGIGDIHILGLFVDHTSQMLKDISEAVIKERDWRNEKLVQNFVDSGFEMKLEDIKKLAGNNVVLTRAHFARYLIEKGYAKDKSEAFDKYLSETTPFYVKRKYLSPEECVEIIIECGGFPVLAHPMIYKMDTDEVESLVVRLKKAGLFGIEALYSTYAPEEEKYVLGLADKYDLKITGGSDFHGSNKPDISIGTGRGNLAIPYELLEQFNR